MCGRFGASYRDFKTVWNVHGDFSFQKRYNMAPSQEVPVIFRIEGRNEAKVMKWDCVNRGRRIFLDDDSPDCVRRVRHQTRDAQLSLVIEGEACSYCCLSFASYLS